MVDLIWYLYHRASHRVRIMWAGHQAHHNSQFFNLTTAVRQKWNPWFELLFWVPLPLLGVPPWLIFTAFSINLIFQFFVHTERVDRLPAPVEFVFNTPSHHRVHHASDADYLDKNFAGILIIWDRLFGSYAEETHRPTYGLTKNYDTTNPFRLQYHEYAQCWRLRRSTECGRSWRCCSVRPAGRCARDRRARPRPRHGDVDPGGDLTGADHDATGATDQLGAGGHRAHREAPVRVGVGVEDR